MQALPYVINIVISCILCLLTFKINKILNRRDEAITREQTQSQAIAEGVQCLLRRAIIEDHGKCRDRGYCPIPEKENIKKEYEAYHKLGGNDVASELYNEVLKMPVEEGGSK